MFELGDRLLLCWLQNNNVMYKYKHTKMLRNYIANAVHAVDYLTNMQIAFV